MINFWSASTYDDSAYKTFSRGISLRPQTLAKFWQPSSPVGHYAACAYRKIAMWYWLDNDADHEITRDVDFAVLQAAIPSIITALNSAKAEILSLSIGGVNARIVERGIRTDFIDRSNEEWGNLQPLYRNAIEAATEQPGRLDAIPIAPPEHLVAMKLAAGTDKDERDAIRLIAKVADLHITTTRSIVKQFLGPASIGRLEECIRRAGHPAARRAYTGAS